MAVCGVLAFSVGAFLPLVLSPHEWLVTLRWAGVLLLAIGAARSKSLTYWIFLSMLIGAEIGFDRPQLAGQLKILSDIFLRLIRVIVAPLIFCSLVTGIAAHGDLRSVRRIALKSLIYFEVVTTVGLFIGLAAINISHAGVGLKVVPIQSASWLPSTQQLRWSDFILQIFPENIAKSIADEQILQVAVFAVLFGIALALVPRAKAAPVLNFFEAFAGVMFRFTNLVMYFAPFGVGAAIAYTFGQMGTAILAPLGKLIATAYVTFLVFIAVVLLPIALFARVPLKRFISAISEPVGIAFATSTSEAALPKAMECMERFGISREIVAFIIPAGYSFNLDGSSLYLSVASVFVAQAAGIHLSAGEQLAMVFALMLTSKGMAGVPRAVLVVLLATATTFHLPQEPIFIIVGVDALIDMGRTALNVTGNCLACAVISRWEEGRYAK